MSDIAKKSSFIEKHLSYEVEMLGFTYEELGALPKGLLANAIFESFATHARLLETFLKNEDKQSNYRAKDYNRGFKPTRDEQVNEYFNRLNAQVFHPGNKRGERQITYSNVNAMYQWLLPNLRAFGTALPPPYKGVWDNYVIVPQINLKLLPVFLTTNATSSVSSCTPRIYDITRRD
jgi:hypothetical protein